MLASGSATEERLAGIWASLLPIPRFELDDDFFDLGGHSLLAVQLLTRIRETFGVELSLDLIYSGKLTIRRLALIIDNGGSIPEEGSGVSNFRRGILRTASRSRKPAMSDEEIQALLLLPDGQ